MRILIATSGSSYSDVALHFGAHLAHSASDQLTVLTVIKNKTDRPRTTAILDRANDLLEPLTPNVQSEVRIGHIVEEITREAEEGEYDLLIVGYKPKNLVERLYSRSVALQIVERTPCPLMIVKGRFNPIQRILLCDSGAKSPSSITQFASKLAEQIEGQEQITILHVMSQISAGPGVVSGQLRAEAEDLIQEDTPEGKLLRQDVHILRESSISSVPKVRHGLVVDEILDEACTGDYDLVIIGAHRGDRWHRILLDNLAGQIIDKLDRPVLVV
ncbi:MAG: universal stress protein [Anaerolineaceae bacterium]|nr:MAG: universal stress protein [Anaerolineaceae bacterium]